MAFKLVDASASAAPAYVDTENQRGRIWPVYETADLLMLRAEISTLQPWEVSGREFTYFIFVESGRVSIDLNCKNHILEKNEALEVPEDCGFVLSNRSDAGASYLVLVIGKEVLPGSFFNTFNSAYVAA
jgi:hypothetical protein